MGAIMQAGLNQKFNLYNFAKENGYTNICEFIETNGVYKKPMTQERYRSIRNAILYNEPAQALKLLQPYREAVK